MAQPALAPVRPSNGHTAPESPSFSVPARHNPRLQALVERLNADEELRQLWRCANVNVVDRLGRGDSGEVHARIVANAALKLLRLLRDAGEHPGVTAQHRLAPDEAEVVVVLAAALHDVDLAIHPDPLFAGLSLAALKARDLLAALYPVRERTILLAEVLHAISALPAEARCLTLEAGVLKVADVLDMTKGRMRLPGEQGQGGGSPAMVDEVSIQRHRTPPVRVLIHLSTAGGARQVETLLGDRLRLTGLAACVEVLAQPAGQADLLPLNVWNGGH